MKRLFIKKGITAGIFIIFLLLFSYKNIQIALEPILSVIENFDFNNLSLASVEELIEELDLTISENVYKKKEYINMYGLLQNMMNKKEESNFEVVKDKSGELHYT